MFYVIDKENKLSIFDDSKEKIDQTREFMPQLDGQYTLETDIVEADELRQHPNKVIVDDIEIEIDVPDYETIIDDDGNEIQVPTGTTHKETITVKGLVLNPDYEEEQAEKERVRIANLHMTRGDVFRGLLLAKGVTRADMRGLIEQMPETTPQEKIAKEYALIDFDEALEFYRGVSLIDTVGEQLGISPQQMDRFFDTKDWHELVNEEE